MCWSRWTKSGWQSGSAVRLCGGTTACLAQLMMRTPSVSLLAVPRPASENLVSYGSSQSPHQSVGMIATSANAASFLLQGTL